MRGAGIVAVGGAVGVLELAAPEISEARQLVVAVKAAGVANWDDIVRTGGWDVGRAPPMALGVAAAGVVHAVGEAVTRFRVGDEVLTHCVPMPAQGAWAELLLVREDQAAHKPSNMSMPVAGLFPVPALTAAQTLSDVLHVQRGERLLVHGAGGITGSVIVALAADMGAWVIATAGPASAERPRAYGASVVLDYHQADWPDQLRRLTDGRGVLAAANAVPGAAASLLPLVADRGRLATITGDPPPAERQIKVSSVYVSSDGPRLEQLATSFAERGLTIPIGATYSLSEADRALSDAVSGRARGGVVLDLAVR